YEPRPRVATAPNLLAISLRIRLAFLDVHFARFDDVAVVDLDRLLLGHLGDEVRAKPAIVALAESLGLWDVRLADPLDRVAVATHLHREGVPRQVDALLVILALGILMIPVAGRADLPFAVGPQIVGLLLAVLRDLLRAAEVAPGVLRVAIELDRLAAGRL